MARVIEMSGKQPSHLAGYSSVSCPMVPDEMGQINIGPVSIGGPAKVRLQWNFLPDITIDLSTVQPTSSFSLMSILKPKATILFGGNAYLIDPYGGSGNTISQGDPSIFNTPTFLDNLSSYGAIPTLMLFGILAYAGYVATVFTYDKFFAKKPTQVTP